MTLMQNNLSSILFVFAYWIILLFCFRISGSQFNPAVTLGLMVKKDTDMSNKKYGLFLMLMQLLGCLVGALVLHWIKGYNRIHHFSGDYVLSAFLTELV
jgi:glycerol uptake facilitator-like aquaporin